jgi:vacuolar-type H+-ATPase subunit I/STV1
MRKDLKTLKDTYRERKKDEYADLERLVHNGNYYWDYKVNIGYKFLWLIDSFLTGLIYLMTAFTLGWVLDRYAVKSLDTNDGKFFIFIQACGQIFYIILVFYLVVYIYGKYLPNLCFYPPPEHEYLKNFSAAFFTIFGIFSIEPKLKEKLKYVFYGTT